MDENLITVYARLNFHQILLEMIQANQIAGCSVPDVAMERFREDLMKLLDPVAQDGAIELAIRQEMHSIAERYLDSLESRVDEVLLNAA